MARALIKAQAFLAIKSEISGTATAVRCHQTGGLEPCRYSSAALLHCKRALILTFLFCLSGVPFLVGTILEGLLGSITLLVVQFAIAVFVECL